MSLTYRQRQMYVSTFTISAAASDSHLAVCCARPFVLAAMHVLQGGKPPVPDMPVQHEPHVASGVMEVQQLGLVQLLMQQHGVVT